MSPGSFGMVRLTASIQVTKNTVIISTSIKGMISFVTPSMFTLLLLESKGTAARYCRRKISSDSTSPLFTGAQTLFHDPGQQLVVHLVPHGMPIDLIFFYKIPFIGGAVMSIVSFCLVQFMRLKPDAETSAGALENDSEAMNRKIKYDEPAGNAQ